MFSGNKLSRSTSLKNAAKYCKGIGSKTDASVLLVASSIYDNLDNFFSVSSIFWNVCHRLIKPA